MAQKKIVQTAGRTQLGEFAPEFAHLNDDILFGEVWSRNDLLSLRDRSLVTLTSLISQGITDSSLTYHLQEAKKNGITRTEISEIITHIAFYAGWPKAWAAFRQAKEVWKEDTSQEDSIPSIFTLYAPFSVAASLRMPGFFPSGALSLSVNRLRRRRLFRKLPRRLSAVRPLQKQGHNQRILRRLFVVVLAQPRTHKAQPLIQGDRRRIGDAHLQADKGQLLAPALGDEILHQGTPHTLPARRSGNRHIVDIALVQNRFHRGVADRFFTGGLPGGHKHDAGNVHN